MLIQIFTSPTNEGIHYFNAIEQYQKTFELEPNYASSYMGLGMTYNKIEEFVICNILQNMDSCKDNIEYTIYLQNDIIEGFMGKWGGLDVALT